MKRAIEKAIEGGFDMAKQLFPHADHEFIFILSWYWLNYDSSASSKGELKVFSRQPKFIKPCINYYSFYDLIFGTDFLAYLKPNEYYCGWHKKPCNKSIKEQMNCDNYSSNLTDVECRYYQWLDSASYHRQQMANMKDVEKLKDYVEGLI